MNENATRYAQSLYQCLQALEDSTEYEEEDAETYLQQWPLDIEIHGKRSAGNSEWSVNQVDVILGLGGPTVWIEFSDTDNATVEYHYGSDSERQYLESSAALALSDVWGLGELFED